MSARWPRIAALLVVLATSGAPLLQGQAAHPARPASAPPPASGAPAPAATAVLDRAAAALAAGDLAGVRRLAEELPGQPAGPDPQVEARRLFLLAVADQLEAERGGPAAGELLQRAAAGYARVLELRPQTVGALYNLARLHRASGDTASALKELKLASELPGKDQAFYLDAYAQMLSGQGAWREAEAAYESEVMLDPRREEPHRILARRYLAKAAQGNPEPLDDYLWRLVQHRQSERAADLALIGLESLRNDWLEGQLLTVIAASLGQRALAPADVLATDTVRRLRALAGRPGIREGVRPLLELYASPACGATQSPWWQSDAGSDLSVPRFDGLRAAMRGIAVWNEHHDKAGEAVACYKRAIDLRPDRPDPVALEQLASLYIEQGNVQAVDQLADRYADLQGALFAGKNEAYRQHQMEKALEYHRALGQIYGYLALNQPGASWGDTAHANTALFQLDHAYRLSKQLDDKKARDTGGTALHLDPKLTSLLAAGYQATGQVGKGNEVRLEAAQRFVAAGQATARDRVLDDVHEETLDPQQRVRYEQYRAVAVPPSKLGQERPAVTPQVTRYDAAKWGREVASVSVEAKRMSARALPASRRELQVPATTLWVDTGVDLAAGQPIAIRASGQWSNAGPPAQGPGGFANYAYEATVLRGAPLASLVGRIGDAMFEVGPEYRGTAPASGRLYLSINDVPGSFDDNQGSLAVVIDLAPGGG